jgi:CRISPR/Cas system CSM-associated protein Csm3 (group 7 of RAMP superfamily)
MSGKVEVEVKKSNFTPRDRVEEGRFNIILDFKAAVPNDSYVFVGGMTKELESRMLQIQAKIDEMARKLVTLDDETIKRNFYDLIQTSKPYMITQFLKYDQTYAIPGSSLKGAIRSRIEYKFKLYKIREGQYGSYSCYIVQEPFTRPNPNHVKFWGEHVTYSRGSCSPPQICAVCDLFGCPSLSSRVFFSDAIMTNGKVEFVKEVRREGAAPNSEFKVNVSLLNADFVDLGLLFSGMEIFTSTPILIGALKYRFNKKVGENRLRNLYLAGLLKFELKSFKPITGDFPSNVSSCYDMISVAREKLLEKYDKYIDLERGVIS